MGKRRLKHPALKLDQQATAVLKTALHNQKSGNINTALSDVSNLLKQHPHHPVVLLHAGNLAWAINNPKQAILYYQESLKQIPDYFDAISNLAAVLWTVGRHDEAMTYYKKSVIIEPKNAHLYHNLGGAWYEKRDVEKAVKAFIKAIKLKPDYSEAWRNLGNCYNEQGKYSDAIKCYKKVVVLSKTGGAIIRAATAIPVIPESIKHIHEIRSQLNENLNQLLDQKIHVVDPVRENGYTNFFLAFHGENDRPLQEKYTQLYVNSCPALGWCAPHCHNYKPPSDGKRIKVAFASRNLLNHSIGNTSKGLIALLSREEFEVIVLTLSPPHDETSMFIEKNCDKFVVLPNNLDSAMKTVASLKLDILYYQDTGLDPFLFFLAFIRLAPIQCTSFGHPVTTGIPNLDYYISTDLWEPDGADAHYSENLVRLRNIASVAYYYQPPVNNILKQRSYYGLSNDNHIYICPQTLFKIHPDFDLIIKGILEGDPIGRVIFIEGIHSNWGNILRNRFRKSIPEITNRIKFLPRQSGEDFVNLIAVSDVMLDTMHFNGFNTTLQGFCVGTPVVTLPGTFMRGRHTMSFYRKMDYMDIVATNVEEYIQLALRLGTDQVFRSKASRIILDRSVSLWEEKRSLASSKISLNKQ